MGVQLRTLERWDVVQPATSDPMIFDGDGGVHGPASNKQAVNLPQPLSAHRGPIQRHMTATSAFHPYWLNYHRAHHIRCQGSLHFP